MLDKCACEHVIDRVRRAEGVSIFELNGFVFLQNLFKEHLVSAAGSNEPCACCEAAPFYANKRRVLFYKAIDSFHQLRADIHIYPAMLV